jgi:hypothetical protein
MLILATRADQRPRYRLDLINCLAYPEGVAARFTYRRRWIDPDIIHGAIPLEGLQGLIVLCDTSDGPGIEYPFLPLRHIVVHAFEPQGFLAAPDDDLFIGVEFSLGRYINIEAGQSAAWRTTWQRWLEGYSERPRPGNLAAGSQRWMFSLDNFAESAIVNPPDVTWQLIATEAARSNALASSTLFRVSGLCSPNTPNCDSIPLVDYVGTKALEIRSGKSSILSLDFYLDPMKSAPPASLVEPSTNSTTLTISQPMFRTIGLSTTASIVLTCAQIYADDVAVIVIENPMDTDARAPRVEFPVKLRKQRGLLFIVLFLLVAGALGTGVSSTTITEIWSRGWMSTHASEVSDVLKLVGSAFVGIAGYLGFHKLPGSTGGSGNGSSSK